MQISKLLLLIAFLMFLFGSLDSAPSPQSSVNSRCYNDDLFWWPWNRENDVRNHLSQNKCVLVKLTRLFFHLKTRAICPSYVLNNKYNRKKLGLVEGDDLITKDQDDWITWYFVDYDDCQTKAITGLDKQIKCTDFCKRQRSKRSPVTDYSLCSQEDCERSTLIYHCASLDNGEFPGNVLSVDNYIDHCPDSLMNFILKNRFHKFSFEIRDFCFDSTTEQDTFCEKLISYDDREKMIGNALKYCSSLSENIVPENEDLDGVEIFVFVETCPNEMHKFVETFPIHLLSKRIVDFCKENSNSEFCILLDDYNCDTDSELSPDEPSTSRGKKRKCSFNDGLPSKVVKLVMMMLMILV